MKKYNSVRINIAKNGFFLNFDEGGSFIENIFVAQTLDEVREILNTKLNMETQE